MEPLIRADRRMFTRKAPNTRLYGRPCITSTTRFGRLSISLSISRNRTGWVPTLCCWGIPPLQPTRLMFRGELLTNGNGNVGTNDNHKKQRIDSLPATCANHEERFCVCKISKSWAVFKINTKKKGYWCRRKSAHRQICKRCYIQGRQR